MLKPILLLYLTAHIGNTYAADLNQEGITRVLVRQNGPTTTAFKPPISTSFSDNCQSSGWALCGNVCYDIKNGATCCNRRTSYSMLDTPGIQGRVVNCFRVYTWNLLSF